MTKKEKRPAGAVEKIGYTPAGLYAVMRVAGASIASKADALHLLSASNHPCKIVYINIDIAVFDDGFSQFSQ